MSDYAKKLEAIKKNRKKLLETETKLIDKRKKEFADLGEQFDLLTLDDKILSQFFADFKNLNYKNNENDINTSNHEHCPKALSN